MEVIKTHDYFFVTALFQIFMGQTLTDNFWGLHKKMNCAFPLTKFRFLLTKFIINNY